MTNYKPGYFQTYPQAIKGILIGLLTATVLISGIVWMIQHPAATLRIYAGSGLLAFALLAAIAHDSDDSKRHKAIRAAFVLFMTAGALRMWIL